MMFGKMLGKPRTSLTETESKLPVPTHYTLREFPGHDPGRAVWAEPGGLPELRWEGGFWGNKAVRVHRTRQDREESCSEETSRDLGGAPLERSATC